MRVLIVAIGTYGDVLPFIGLAAELDVSLPGVAADMAEQIVDAAKRNCPYSNATRGNVETRVSIVQAG